MVIEYVLETCCKCEGVLLCRKERDAEDPWQQRPDDPWQQRQDDPWQQRQDDLNSFFLSSFTYNIEMKHMNIRIKYFRSKIVPNLIFYICCFL